MPNNQVNRIAKNTVLLYMRTFFTMLIGLYTSRIVLKNLGVEDFGIYSAVGGVVAMFSVITGSLTAAIQRFLTFELGKGNQEKLTRIFSSSVTIQVVMAFIVVVVAEIVGIWFLNNKMNIPAARMDAANWVLHFTLASFAITLVSVPYNAAIIAHERMSAFAYIGVFEAICKLGIAFLILKSPVDTLVFYTFLMCSVAIVIRFVYGAYCKRMFAECSYRIIFDKALFKQMFGFAGWNFIGASSAILREQGGNILLNVFFGPTMNAAKGISSQVNGAVSQFISGFTTAMNPQITKSYASGDYDYMMKLLFWGSRLSYYMLFLIALPIILNAEFLLDVWLVDYPSYAIVFVQLVMLFSLSESISNPLITVMLATGNIRNYQIVVGGLQMMNFPVSYIGLKMGYPATFVLIVAVVISQLCFFARLFMLNKMIQLQVALFLKKVYCNILAVSIIAAFFPYILSNLFEKGLFCFILSVMTSFVSSSFVIFFIGCSKKERELVMNKAKVWMGRFKHA